VPRRPHGHWRDAFDDESASRQGREVEWEHLRRLRAHRAWRAERAWRAFEKRREARDYRYYRRAWRRRRWGLRRRLAFAFAFVALAAVILTTVLTLGAAMRARHELAAGAPAPAGVMHEAFLAALLAFLLASVAASAVTRFLTRPLMALTAGARRLAAGERGVRLRVPSSDDELRVLTEAFNQLTEGLEREEAWRRDLVADVAHDLRTPIAVLRSELEAMQDGIRQPDAEGLSRLHAEVMMLSHLVDDLRTLSLAEAGGTPLRRVTTPVAPLLQRTRDAFSMRAADAGVDLTLTPVEASLSVYADPDRILQVLGNLVDNALRHGAGAPVELAARAAQGGALLTVRDHGPGLPEGAAARVFERFYRGDPARSRRARPVPGAAGPAPPANADAASDAAGDGATGGAGDGATGGAGDGAGSGLGLAIVKALVEAHGGRVEARNHEGGGAVFSVWLPVDAGPDAVPDAAPDAPPG
jgi:two-component system, OmpR family, sensor histidine kinase BaeS